MKLFTDPDHETWYPEAVTAEERKGLEVAAANAEYLSNDDLRNLVRIVNTLDGIDRTKQEEVERQQAIQEHYRQERAREVQAALNAHAQEVVIKRQRIAQALNIAISEVPPLE